jgi:hypothetical protein
MDEPKEGYYGGKVAAPVFHDIAERAANYLDLKPEIETAPSANPVLTAGGGPGGPVRIAAK